MALRRRPRRRLRRPFGDQGQFRREAPGRRLCARHSGPRRGHAARSARRPRRGARERSPSARPRRSASSARSARSPRPSSPKGRRARRLLIVGLGGPAGRRGELGEGRRRADRAAAHLGRDPAGGRSRRPQDSTRARPPGSPSAPPRAAGATTSTAPVGPQAEADARGAGHGRRAARAPSAEWAHMAAVLDGLDLTRTLVTEPANIVYPESFVDRCREAMEGQGVEIRGARREGDGQARHGRLARRRPGLGAAAAPAGDALERRQGRHEAGRLRRQGHHLRYRRHLDQAGARHGSDEVGHGRRRRGRRR